MSEQTNKQKRKVLIVGQHFWPESFRINDIADYLLENDCDVEVLCGLPNYPSGSFFPGYSYLGKYKEFNKGIEIHRAAEIRRGSNSSIRIFLNYVSFPIASLFHIPRLLFKRYDKIFIYQLSPVMMAITGIIVGRLKNTETTMYVLDLWPENLYSVIKVRNRVLRKIAESVSHWHYRHVDKLVALSGRMSSKLADVSGKKESEILVLPQACEKVYENDIDDSELAGRFTGFNIVFAGNISPAQSFETIIGAATQLNNEGVKNINWIIVGDGMSRKWLENEVKSAGLSENFHFEGFKPVEDIPRYTGIADILVACLSKSDLLEATIPAKVMSYIASGKPMVLAMDGEVQGLINDTIGCGLVGPTEDPAILANNIKSLYKMDASKRRIMGARGREYHFKHFERNILLGKLLRFIFS